MTDVAFTWTLGHGDTRGARLNQKLFGFRYKSNNKQHHIDGLLARWEDGNRIPNCEYQVLGVALFSIPESMVRLGWDMRIKEVFDGLGIAFRKLYIVEAL